MKTGSLKHTLVALGLLVWQPVPAGVPVTTTPLESLIKAPVYSAPATVVARNRPLLAAEINAAIASIEVRVGDTVNENDLLATLDCRQYESALKASQAGLEKLRVQSSFAETQYKRATDLQEARGISEESVDQRLSELESLSAQLKVQQETLEQARLQVEHCEIRAPFKAVIIDKLADVGSLATVGTPILELIQVDDIEVSANLRERDISGLETAANIRFSYMGESYPLSLRSILPVVDAKTNSREVRLKPQTTDLPAGASGRVDWDGSRHQLAAEYLVRRNGLLGVFYVDDNRAKFHPIEDAIEGQAAFIDLPQQTMLIVEGRQRLNNNDEISVIDRDLPVTSTGTTGSE